MSTNQTVKSNANTSIYMKFTNIDGDVTAKKYEKQIKLHSVEWTAERNLHTEAGNANDRGNSKPIIGEMTITKRGATADSPMFLGKLLKPKEGAAKNATISLVQTGETLTTYFEFTIDLVMLSKYGFYFSTDKQEDGTVMSYPIETLKLNFTKIEVRATPSGSDGKHTSSVAESYDIVTAT